MITGMKNEPLIFTVKQSLFNEEVNNFFWQSIAEMCNRASIDREKWLRDNVWNWKRLPKFIIKRIFHLDIHIQDTSKNREKYILRRFWKVIAEKTFCSWYSDVLND